MDLMVNGFNGGFNGECPRTSLVIQWLRLCASTARVHRVDFRLGSKDPDTTRCGQKIKIIVLKLVCPIGPPRAHGFRWWVSWFHVINPF